MNTRKNTSKDYNEDMFSAIEQALDKLPNNPPPRIRSAREMIHELADKIRSKIDLGYTYQHIVDTLKEAGCSISVGTLKTYLSQATRAKQPRSTKRQTVQKHVVNTQSTDSPVQASTPVQRPAVVPPRPPAFQDPDEK